MKVGNAAAALATAALLVAPATAGATIVEVGPFGKANQKRFQDALADGNAYFGKSVTVNQGDTVTWGINGFHSVTFVPRGSDAPPLIAPDTTRLVTGVNDAANQPFWFNGQPRLLFNPAAVMPAGGGTHSPSRLTGSGLPLSQNAPRRFLLRFNRTGRFHYLCVVHPGMKGSVRVVRRGRRTPSERANRRRARREQRSVLQRALRLSNGLGTEDLEKTIQAGNDRKSGETVFKFFPTNPSFRVGETVTLQMAPGSTDVHTITFGPSNGKDAYNDQVATNFIAPDTSTNPPALVVDPRAGYPSENPQSGIPNYNGLNHGNGFFNSGILDVDARSPLPPSTKLTFTAPGKFKFICLVHPFMAGEATVTP